MRVLLTDAANANFFMWIFGYLPCDDDKEYETERDNVTYRRCTSATAFRCVCSTTDRFARRGVKRYSVPCVPEHRPWDKPKTIKPKTIAGALQQAIDDGAGVGSVTVVRLEQPESRSGFTEECVYYRTGLRVSTQGFVFTDVWIANKNPRPLYYCNRYSKFLCFEDHLGLHPLNALRSSFPLGQVCIHCPGNYTAMYADRKLHTLYCYSTDILPEAFQALSVDSVVLQPPVWLSPVTVHEFAFYEAILHKVYGSSHIDIVGECAFERSHLRHISFGKALTCIESNAFHGAKSLETVVFSPHSNVEIEEWAFAFSGLQHVTCSPNPLTPDQALQAPSCLPKMSSISVGCFSNTRLREVVIPDGVKSIGEEAFAFCEYLSRLKLPSTLTTLHMGAFEGARLLKNVTLPSNVMTIPENCFYDCRSMEEAVLLGVKSLEHKCFANCFSLASVKGTENVRCFFGKPFDGCLQLGTLVATQEFFQGHALLCYKEQKLKLLYNNHTQVGHLFKYAKDVFGLGDGTFLFRLKQRRKRKNIDLDASDSARDLVDFTKPTFNDYCTSLVSIRLELVKV